MRSTNTTIVDFYQGAYGPTIRIDIQNFEWLKLFKESVIQLRNSSISELDLLRLHDVEKEDISELKLLMGLNTSLVLISPTQTGNHTSFRWTINAEAIKNMVSAIDSLIKSNKSGHFYLYDEDDFLIELAYKE